MNAKARAGTYLYAVLEGAGGSHGATGVGGGPVHCLVEGDLAAAVSEVRAARVRPERRAVSAHHAVLERLMRDSTLLPAAFGLIAESEEAVRRVLRDNAEALREQLAHVAGKVEMGVRVSWSAPDLFGYFVATHPELREERDRLRARGGGSRDEKIAVGQLLASIVEEEREACAARVVEALEASGAEVKQNPPRDEREVMSLACLVAREERAAFERAVGEAAAGFDEHFRFTLTGPWAPYNFTSIKLAG